MSYSDTTVTKYDGIKAGIWYTVGNILVKAIPFLSLPIFTRLMTTEDFGIYNTYLSYENILSILLGLGFSQTVKVAKIDFEDSFERYVSSAFSVVLFLGSVFLLIMNILFPIAFQRITFFKWMNPLILNILIINSVATAVYAIMGAKYVIVGKYKENLGISLIMTALNIGSSLLLCAFFLTSDRSLARIMGTMVGAVAVAVFILYAQATIFPLRIFDKARRYAFRYGLPLIPHQLSISLFSQCDKIMIQAMVGNSEAGIYGLAVNIMLVLSVLVSSFDNAWTPWLFSALTEKKYTYIRKTNNTIVVFFVYIYSGFLLLSPDVIHIFSEKSYWGAVYALIPLAVSSYINFIYMFSVAVEYYHKRTGVISMATLLCTGANIILNYVFINVFGFLGAAYATCITKLLLFFVHFIVSKKIQKERTADLLYLMAGLLFLAMVAFFSSFFANVTIIRMIAALGITLINLFYFLRIGMVQMLFGKYIKKK